MFEKRFCAHRGVSALIPENTLPAFAAALALGADEIEFDIRLTKDDQLIVSHDPNLARVAGTEGDVSNFTLDELRKLNVGGKHGWTVGFCTPEEVFAQFANKLTFNIHLKQHGEDGYIIRELHEKNICCNLFYADTFDDYRNYFDMGIDTLLTNRMDLAAAYRKNVMQ